ncbi:MAG: DUF5615 family PIN-like protein [Synechococcus sp.]
MIIWLDVQLPPLLANWINGQSWDNKGIAVRDLALRDATESTIFQAARAAGVVVMRNDRDFIHLLASSLEPGVAHLQAGEPWVEIRPL